MVVEKANVGQVMHDDGKGFYMNIEIRIVDNVNVFTVYGDFTFNSLGAIRDTIKKDIASASSTKFLVDLSQVGMIDSTGVGTIVSIYKTILARQGKFGIVVPSGDLKELFTTIGLNKLFPIYDNESQAINGI